MRADILLKALDSVKRAQDVRFTRIILVARSVAAMLPHSALLSRC
jgi:hypothetical protein